MNKWIDRSHCLPENYRSLKRLFWLHYPHEKSGKKYTGVAVIVPVDYAGDITEFCDEKMRNLLGIVVKQN